MLHQSKFYSLVIFCVIGVLGLPAFGQDKCKTDPLEAQAKYDNGRFDEAIALLNGCLRRCKLDTVESEKVYTLLAKANLAKEYRDKARENIVQLRKLVPNWRPNPEVDTPEFQRFANNIINSQSRGKKWLFIGGGAAAAGALAFIVFKGEETVAGPPALPGPPDIPPRP